MVAVGTLALFTNWSTTTQFQDYVTQDTQRNQRFMEALVQADRVGRDPHALSGSR